MKAYSLFSINLFLAETSAKVRLLLNPTGFLESLFVPYFY